VAGGSRSAAGRGSGGCERSGELNDLWDCRIGKADPVVLALLADAPSEFKAFGTPREKLRGFDG
jgi:hypothetical protein